jgi:pyruvate-ferredoxin/flavodoxin oxidoreductase
VAQFAAGGKSTAQEGHGHDLLHLRQRLCCPRGSLGANPGQAVKAFNEAEAYDGPSLIIAYAHCINHGINMAWVWSSRRRR